MAAAVVARSSRRAFRGVLVDCEDLAKWDGISAPLFLDRFARDGDEWSVVRAAKGEKLGSPSELDAVILTGSHYSANDDEPWIADLCEWLRVAVTGTPQGPRVFAACFGHQVLARALGGEVSTNPGGEFFFRAAHVAPRPAFARLPWAHGIVEAPAGGEGPVTVRGSGFDTELGPLTGPFADDEHKDAARRPAEPSESLRILKAHGDAVVRPPPGAAVLASSPGVGCEVYVAGVNGAAEALEAGGDVVWSDLRALSVQGHAEFTPRLMREKILPALRERMGEEEAARFDEAAACPCHDWAVLTIADRFLRRRD